MPPKIFVTLLVVVIIAAGLTVWLLSLGGPLVIMVALPAVMVATVATHLLRK